MKLITASEIQQYMSMQQCVEVIREAVVHIVKGTIVIPDRNQLDVGPGITLIMPALWPDKHSLTTKIISVFPNNPQQGLPTTFALLALLDTRTGEVQMLCEGSSLTALRTGALSGVATDCLSRSDAKTLTICGAGRHARTQLAANMCARDFQSVHILSRSAESAQAMINEVQPLYPNVEFQIANSDSIQAADVISCATTSGEPVFDGSLVQPGTHVNAIGAFTPTTRELDSELISQATLFMDTKDGCLEEAGDFLIPISEGRITEDALQTEIGSVVAGDKPGRTSDDQITVFKSVGSAAFDVAAAYALSQSLPEEVGTSLTLDR